MVSDAFQLASPRKSPHTRIECATLTANDLARQQIGFLAGVVGGAVLCALFENRLHAFQQLIADDCRHTVLDADHVADRLALVIVTSAVVILARRTVADVHAVVFFSQNLWQAVRLF